MSNSIAAQLPAAESAISQFLQTVLSKEVPITIALGEPGEEPAVPPGVRIIVSGADAPQWMVQLMPEWIPLISAAILGEPMDSSAPEADDLLVEMVGQVVSNVARALGTEGRRIPQDALRAVPGGGALPTFSGACLTAVVVAAVDDAEMAAWVTFLDPSGTVEIPEPAKPVAHADKPSEATILPSHEVQVSPVSYQDLGPESIPRGDGAPASFDMLGDVELDISVEIGRRNLPLSDVLKLTTGSVIELEKLVGEPLEVYANGRLIAEGEAVVIDEQFGIRITRLVSPGQRAKTS